MNKVDRMLEEPFPIAVAALVAIVCVIVQIVAIVIGKESLTMPVVGAVLIIDVFLIFWRGLLSNIGIRNKGEAKQPHEDPLPWYKRTLLCKFGIHLTYLEDLPWRHCPRCKVVWRDVASPGLG